MGTRSEELLTLLSPCPACGKPRPIGAADQARCEACGATLPVSREIREAARAFKAAAANAPLQLQQADDIGVLIRRGAEIHHRFRVAAALLGAPLLVLFLFGFDRATMWPLDHTRQNVVSAPAMMVPLLLLLAISLGVGVRARRQTVLVDSLLWAYPIAELPGSFACRSCGGPIAVGTMKRASITCSYCRTENIAGSDVSRRAAKLALANYASKTDRAVARLRGGGRPGLFTLLLLTPVLVLVALFYGAHRIVEKLERKAGEFDATIEYVWTKCPTMTTGTIWKADGPSRPEDRCVRYMEVPVISRFDISEFRSAEAVECEWPEKTLRSYEATAPKPRVVDLYRDGFERNVAIVDLGTGEKRRCFLEGMRVDTPYVPTDD